MTSTPWAAPELTALQRAPMHAIRHTHRHRPRRHVVLPAPGQSTAGAVFRLADITVPGCWTMQDTYDYPRYTNVQMPFPDLPPRPPAENPTGVYERTLEVPSSWAGRRMVLHVGAAESVLVVQINGRDVGISKDSHLAAEFEIDDYVQPGETCTLRLRVVKWSDASFIEDQDQWWHGGITRSVVVYATPRVYLADVHATAGLADDRVTGTLDLRVEVSFSGQPPPAARRSAERTGLVRGAAPPVAAAHQPARTFG